MGELRVRVVVRFKFRFGVPCEGGWLWAFALSFFDVDVMFLGMVVVLRDVFVRGCGCAAFLDRWCQVQPPCHSVSQPISNPLFNYLRTILRKGLILAG